MYYRKKLGTGGAISQLKNKVKNDFILMNVIHL